MVLKGTSKLRSKKSIANEICKNKIYEIYPTQIFYIKIFGQQEIVAKTQFKKVKCHVSYFTIILMPRGK